MERQPTCAARQQGKPWLASLWLLLALFAAGWLSASSQPLQASHAVGALAQQRTIALAQLDTIAPDDSTVALERSPALPADGEAPCAEEFNSEKEDDSEANRARRLKRSAERIAHSLAALPAALPCVEHVECAHPGDGQHGTLVSPACGIARIASPLRSQIILGVSPARGPPSA